MGSVAAAAYLGPMNTEDIDLLVDVQTDTDFVAVYRALEAKADRVDGAYQVIKDTFAQLFPTTISPLYADAYETSKEARIGVLHVRVVDAEHLILMALVAYRPDKDIQRIRLLLRHAQKTKRARLIERLDDVPKRPLARRLAALS